MSSLPDVVFKANVKRTTKLSEDNTISIKTTITIEHEAFKFGRKRLNNAHKGCLAKAVASIDGNSSSPASYSIISIDEAHVCLNTTVDRLKEEAVRKMKQKINDNPVRIGVYDTWQTVQNNITKDLSDDAKAAFIEKLGKFENISKSLYNVKRSSIPPAPKDVLEFDTNIPWFNYRNESILF